MQVLRKSFNQPLHPKIAAFVSSVENDEILIEHDIRGSEAHAAMLQNTGLLDKQEHDNIARGLATLKTSLISGEARLRPEFEDVHMNVEKQLEELIGQDALRLHTARSRNDQVALDLRLYVRQEIQEVIELCEKLQTSLLNCAQRHGEAVMPGYTHLQRAQPVLFAHQLHAVVEMLSRDTERLRDCSQRTSVSPLGAGAIAGTSLAIDPGFTSSQLDMPATFHNSIDAVSDRDFVAEFVFCCSMLAIHLSQLSETLIVWSTKEFGFVFFSDAVTTSSSLMPQKKNPDPLEIARGKTGLVIGELVNVLATLKALPLGYNRDLQETKPPAARVALTIKETLQAVAIVVDELSVNGERTLAAARDPELMATDLVEYLVGKGVPFRQAHDAISALVHTARTQNTSIDRISLPSYKAICPAFTGDVYELFDPLRSVNAKKSAGGTGPEQVQNALSGARDRLGSI